MLYHRSLAIANLQEGAKVNVTPRICGLIFANMEMKRLQLALAVSY